MWMLILIVVTFVIAITIAMREKNRMRGIRGYSKTTEALVFKQDIDEPMSMLQRLFGIQNDDPLDDVWQIDKPEQHAYFAEKYNIDFNPDTKYFLHSY